MASVNNTSILYKNHKQYFDRCQSIIDSMNDYTITLPSGDPIKHEVKDLSMSLNLIKTSTYDSNRTYLQLIKTVDSLLNHSSIKTISSIGRQDQIQIAGLLLGLLKELNKLLNDPFSSDRVKQDAMNGKIVEEREERENYERMQEQYRIAEEEEQLADERASKLYPVAIKKSSDKMIDERVNKLHFNIIKSPKKITDITEGNQEALSPRAEHYENKYLKYKMKYLKLKNRLN